MLWQEWNGWNLRWNWKFSNLEYAQWILAHNLFQKEKLNALECQFPDSTPEKDSTHAAMVIMGCRVPESTPRQCRESFYCNKIAADTVCFVWLLAAGIWNWYLKGHWFALEQFSTTSLPLWQEEIRSLLGDLAAQTVESTNTEVQSVEWVGVQTWNWFVFFLDCITPEVEDEWPERVRLWWMG